MINTKFEAYKVKRELKRSGKQYTFERTGINDFGEPSKQQVAVATICGLYHEQSSNIDIVTGETVQIRTQKIPMILCVHGTNVDLLKAGDKVYVGKKLMKVTGVVNIQEWGIISDISLEVIDLGD